MEGSATSSSLQVLCSSSSSAGGGGGGGTHHHLLQFNHQSRVARFPGSSPSGVRLTTTSTTTLGKAATATGTARCGSKGVSLDSTNDPPHGGEEEEEQGRWVEKLMGENIGRDKCKDDEGKGLAELLECLEREAIMGDDNGKQPTDYNRRAQIFDRSSRFFQHHHQPSPP